MNLDSDLRRVSCFYLQSGNHLLSHLLGGHKVTGHFGVNDPVLLLPAHDDGLLPVGRAAHLLLLALCGQGGVGVGRDHRRNWKAKRDTDLFGDLGFLIFPTVTISQITSKRCFIKMKSIQETAEQESRGRPREGGK